MELAIGHRRIRVLQFLTVDDLAGTELMTYDLVQAMDKDRFDVHVAFLLNRGSLSERLERAGIPVHCLRGNEGFVRPLRELIELVRSKHFDLVHLYGFKTSILGRAVFKALSRTTATVHGIRGQHVSQSVDTASLTTRAAIQVERLLSPLIDYYISNSKGAVEFLTERGLPEPKFVRIPSGIDTAEWAQVAPSAKSVPVIACVARFHAQKRHADLIEALTLLASNDIAFRCVLAGDGPLLDNVKSQVDRSGLKDRIEFRGKIEPTAIRELLAEADLFALSSQWEGLPRSVVEAMAVGLPVVGTDVNGTNELVIHGVTGLLVPPRDPTALAQSLTTLLLNAQMRREMGRRGRMRVEEEFDLRKTTRQLEEFYASIVSVSTDPSVAASPTRQ